MAKGRPRMYETEEERKKAHAKQAIEWYHKNYDNSLELKQKRNLNKRLRYWMGRIRNDFNALDAVEFQNKYYGDGKVATTQESFQIILDFCEDSAGLTIEAVKNILTDHFSHSQ